MFALTAATLDRLGLTVLDARIITSRSGYALDSYTVLEDSGIPIQERARIKEIVTSLQHQLNQPDARRLTISRRTPRVLKHFPTPTQVSFSDDELNGRTVVEVITSDRPGLLSQIGRAFMQCGIRLQNAKIATIGARAEDLFFITNQDNRPLQADLQRAALREALVRHLDGAR